MLRSRMYSFINLRNLSRLNPLSTVSVVSNYSTSNVRTKKIVAARTKSEFKDYITNDAHTNFNSDTISRNSSSNHNATNDRNWSPFFKIRDRDEFIKKCCFNMGSFSAFLGFCHGTICERFYTGIIDCMASGVIYGAIWGICGYYMGGIILAATIIYWPVALALLGFTAIIYITRNNSTYSINELK